jgi:hypothetical protein
MQYFSYFKEEVPHYSASEKIVAVRPSSRSCSIEVIE